MERRRIRIVAVLLAIVVAAQVLAVVARRREEAPAGVALAPGTDPVVSDALLSEGRVLRATVTGDTSSPPVQALYGEPGRSDPLEGRMLAVGSAYSDLAPVVPTSETSGFRLVDMGTRSFAVGHDRAWTWVTWKLPNCTPTCQGYAAGRNLSEAEVVEAARATTPDRNAPAVPGAALPPGLAPLVSARFDLRDLSTPGAQSVAWLWDGAAVGFSVVPDPKLALLLRFWIDGGPVGVRNRPGAHGELAKIAGGADVVARAWSEGGRSLVVVSDRMLYDDFERFVAGLRVARAGEWEAVRARVLDVSSDGLLDSCRAGGPFAPAGRPEGRYRWAVGFGTGPQNQFASCAVLLTPDTSSLSAGGFPRPAPRGLSVSTTGVTGAQDLPGGLFVLGAAPAGTARVRLEVADGRQLDAELAAVGPAPGERYYAAFVEGSVRLRPTVVALNGSGAELARAAGGGPA